MKKIVLGCMILSLFAALFGCKPKTDAAAVTARYPEWAKNAVLYEVNIRQYTPEGTFKAAEAHLPRLKELGVDVLWLMPIHPIGEKNRKGPLGSYYSVKDYTAVNPGYGTLDDLKEFIKQAHAQGLKVILDWVANHTAWDNPWMTDHKDWYKHDSTGKIVSPFDWSDVAQLDFSNQEMRKAMIDAMKYWITHCDIDGFRCDVAGMVPRDFWEAARIELEKTKPLFMLAENEDQNDLCLKAFDANYGWEMHHLFSQVAKGKEPAWTIVRAQQKFDSVFPKDAMKMNFITNHDENSWNGTAQEKFGAGENTFAVLSFTLPGIPLIYSGQEAMLSHRLKFFEKDSIDWSNQELVPFYKSLTHLKHTNEAFFNPPFGGNFVALKNSDSTHILSFLREKGKETFVVVANLSSNPMDVTIKDKQARGEYEAVLSFGSNVTTIDTKTPFKMEPWGYVVLKKK